MKAVLHAVGPAWLCSTAVFAFWEGSSVGGLYFCALLLLFFSIEDAWRARVRDLAHPVTPRMPWERRQCGAHLEPGERPKAGGKGDR